MKRDLWQTMQYHWENPPSRFNSDYDSKAKDRYKVVTESMERDNYYDSHSREECRLEWRKRYNNLI